MTKQPKLTPRQKLEKAHWFITSQKRMGMIRVIRWCDPQTGQVHSQYEALNILRGRELDEKRRAAGQTLEPINETA